MPPAMNPLDAKVLKWPGDGKGPAAIKLPDQLPDKLPVQNF